MSAEENKALARRFVEEFFNRKNLNIMDELYAPDCVEHSADLPGPLHGREAVKQFFGSFLAAFPDFHLTLEAEIAEGDTVVQRFTVSGTNKGELMGMPPTGKRATWTGMHIARIVGGKAVEGWGIGDTLGLMQQLGVIPAPEQAPTA